MRDANIWKQSWIILNPKGNGGNAVKQKDVILEKARELGWEGQYFEISSDKAGSIFVKEAAEAGIRQVVVGGGDGTIREVLKPASQADLTLGILPLGTGNVLARNLGIPLQIEQAVEVALCGKTREIDLGEVNGSYFGVITGMGFDVDTMNSTGTASKSRFGIIAYILTGLRTISQSRKKYRVVIDGNKDYIFRAKSVAVANMARTVGGIEIAPGAGPLSNDLKVVVVSTRDIKSWINLIFNAIRGKVKKSPYYQLFKAREVEIYPLKEPRHYEIDGDVLPPTSKLEIKFHPKALKVMV